MSIRQIDIKVIALDFDGTIVESNHIKDQAFETIFSDWPEHKEAMLEWHLARDTTDRSEKFRYFVEDVLGETGNNKLVSELTERFSELTFVSIVSCPMVEGAMSFLDHYKDKVPLVLVSATPQSELEKILEERKLDRYFQEFYGAPINKVEILNKIMSDNKITSDEMLYIGDSPKDQKAAMSLSVHFIGRKSDRELVGAYNSIYSEFLKIKEHLDQNYVI